MTRSFTGNLAADRDGIRAAIESLRDFPHCKRTDPGWDAQLKCFDEASSGQYDALSTKYGAAGGMNALLGGMTQLAAQVTDRLAEIEGITREEALDTIKAEFNASVGSTEG